METMRKTKRIILQHLKVSSNSIISQPYFSNCTLKSSFNIGEPKVSIHGDLSENQEGWELTIGEITKIGVIIQSKDNSGEILIYGIPQNFTKFRNLIPAE